MVECPDGFARMTSKELATTHSVKSGTLQCACSTRPRVVADLGKNARMRSKKNDDKSAVAILKKYELHDRTGQSVVNHEKSHDVTWPRHKV